MEEKAIWMVGAVVLLLLFLTFGLKIFGKISSALGGI